MCKIPFHLQINLSLVYFLDYAFYYVYKYPYLKMESKKFVVLFYLISLSFLNSILLTVPKEQYVSDIKITTQD